MWFSAFLCFLLSDPPRWKQASLLLLWTEFPLHLPAFLTPQDQTLSSMGQPLPPLSCFCGCSVTSMIINSHIVSNQKFWYLFKKTRCPPNLLCCLWRYLEMSQIWTGRSSSHQSDAHTPEMFTLYKFQSLLVFKSKGHYKLLENAGRVKTYRNCSLWVT